jgi:prepilin-type N-terminal cleavage/methylation domain-containing protein
MRFRRRLNDSSGFTLVEVMVAIMLLTIGVLGTIALADGASRSTSSTRAREGATNVARDVLEGVHAVPWASLTPSSATTKVQAISGLGDSSSGTAGWQIDRRGTTYTVSLSVCSVDDASDGFSATHDSTFCALAGTSAKPPDSNPVDYKRGKVTISWSDVQAPRSITQTTTVANIDNGPSPTVTPRSPVTGPPYAYTGSGTSLDFDVTTDQSANNVDWLLSGTKQGAASGSGIAWNFTWPIGAATGGQATGQAWATPSCSPTGTGKLDGTYFLGAQAFSSSGLSAGPQAATVTLNRCVPMAPKGLEAGKSTALGKLEVQWNENDEDDIAGYRVFRSPNGNANTYSQIDDGGCAGLLTTIDCLDTDASISGVGSYLTQSWYYRVYAYDRDSNGNLRQGDLAAVSRLPSNQAPSTPTIYSGAAVGYPTYTLVWPLSTDADGIDYYWVYRDGQTFAKRWDATDLFAASGVGWEDPDPSGGPHNYWVTAVDTKGNESAFSNLVTK